MKKEVNILNKKARFSYDLLDSYTAGIVLAGTEIKSIRAGKASIAESFCEFNSLNELFVVNMTIQVYEHGNFFNHKPKAQRKLLLNKKELIKLEKEVKNFDFVDIETLNVYLDDQKRILPRRVTELSIRNQRRLTKAVKRARLLGLLPFTVQAEY